MSVTGHSPSETVPERSRTRAELRSYLAADSALKAARSLRDKAFQAAFPRGTEVTWMHGQYVQRGEVLMHGHAATLKARNFHTGREVWVEAYNIRLFDEVA